MGWMGHSGRDSSWNLVMPMMTGHDNRSPVDDLRNPCFFGLIFGSRLHPRRMPTSPGSHKFPPIVGRGSGGTYHEAAGFIRAGLSMVVCEKVRPPPDLPSVNQPVLVACVMRWSQICPD
ncbi:hypothetical protein BDQ94DRAFT_147500 [Aspergillus welwitschiae]|uniref:Uncharacterized protein n=1 Tax=Aspergillus welwitschiae TaxID=1341132 RepID=A0A3F3PW06_9EURO|nr:hypothetical protein BDQ94DRAFT_147500 [Aspergillus welwitschiae]RDH31121.1 hypothetical protein BDQ94DRAFT_147500 [Aspergillus welwitschiae]